MENELQDIETTYQRNLKKLADYVSQLRKRVQRWRMPTYLKNYYYRLIQSWQTKQKAKLTQERDAANRRV
jgi:nitrate/nitrite-specific signal transduction histidine kinase